jgi:hypothetical protein
MIIKTLIISICAILIFILALGIKMLLRKNGKPPSVSCALEDGKKPGDDTACLKCELKDLANCPEKGKKVKF